MWIRLLARTVALAFCTLLAGCDSAEPDSPAGRACAADAPAPVERSDVRPDLVGGLDALVASTPYPEADVAAGTEGDVHVRFVVQADGAVCDAGVIRSVSVGLDRAALASVERAQFLPGRQNGVAVPVRLVLVFAFRIP